MWVLVFRFEWVVHGLFKLAKAILGVDRPAISGWMIDTYRYHDMVGRSYRGGDLVQADTSVRIKASSRFRSRSRTQRLKKQSFWSLHHFASPMRHQSKDAFERLLQPRPVSYTVVVFTAVAFVCDGCSWSIAPG